MVVQQDARATHASQGEWTRGTHKQEDGHDTVAWAAALPYSNGNVGMFGGCYLGNPQRGAAVTGAPVCGPSLLRPPSVNPEEGLNFRGGLIELGTKTWWAWGRSWASTSGSVCHREEAMEKTMATVHAWDSVVIDGYC